MNSTSEREPSSGENSTSSVYSRACATAARACPLTSSRVVCSLCSMCMSLVAMNVWMRGRSESRTAFHAASMSCLLVRASPQMTGPSTSRAIACDRLEVAGRGDREAGLDHVDAEPRQLVGDLELFLACSARSPATARRRAASCRRSGRGSGSLRRASGVAVGAEVLMSFVLLLCSRLPFLSAGYAATRPPRAIPPEGGAGEGREARTATTSATEGSTAPRGDPRRRAQGVSTTLPTFRRSMIIVCASPASSKVKAPATTGLTVPSSSISAAARSTAAACRGPSTA